MSDTGNLSYGQQRPDVLGGPIQDIKGPSPLYHISYKRVASVLENHANVPKNGDGEGQAAFRNHYVNYSFGQYPFIKEVQLSYRFGGGNESPKNSMRNSALPPQVAGAASYRAVHGGEYDMRTGSKNYFQPANAVISSMQSAEGESNANSKGKKSAISVTSVMGHFEYPGHGSPNIFAQSLQQSSLPQSQPGTSSLAQKPKRRTPRGNGSKAKPPIPGPMTQTQQNFASTASKIEQMEQMVSAGLSRSKDRQSQHSLEAEQLGLRKSVDGKYEQVENANDSGPATAYGGSRRAASIGKGSSTGKGPNAEATAASGPQQAFALRRLNTIVPEKIHDEMIQKGYRPSSKQDGQFEYDSDTIEKYEMISNEFDYEAIRQDSQFGIKQYKDCIYRGQLNQNRKREGLGVLVYQNGRVYEGEWIENKRHGRGYELFSTGNSYHGTYEGGKANGKGVYQWKNGEVYDGEWMMGIKHGYGVWKGTNGESYIGQWQAGKAQGYGVHVFANGDKYEGEWLQCLRHGNGSDFFANGDCYVGQYTAGKPEGFGQYKWKNGSSYTGQFLNGLKHGHGKWKKKQADEFGNTKCNSYEGMYENDKKHGYGVFEWESGNRYEGNYNEDERDGYGVMRWTDESTYMGMWNQGIYHGAGVMVFPDGVKRAGVFEDNVFVESLKRKDQIDPYREVLKEDCLQLLEDILAKRDQSKATLFGPLNKSKAELMAKDLTMQSLNNQSVTSIPRDASEGRVPSMGKQESLVAPPPAATDVVSDNASVLNQPMRNADKEDHTMAMQKGNPMRESIGKAMSNRQHLQHFQTVEAALPPMPATATPQKQKPHLGRTIEVQTDLSMVTMEQYSQGYNSKAFMNRTNEFNDAYDKNAKRDNHSSGSPAIKFQNGVNANMHIEQQPSVNQSNRDFYNVLSKSQFQDTKHQQEILGGGNPNEDTESEWNRNNSSMMVRKNTNFGQGTTSQSINNAGDAFEFQNNYEPSRKNTRAQAKINSLSYSRGRKSNEHSRGRAGAQAHNYTSPYASHNRMERAKPAGAQGSANVLGNQAKARDPKFVDRSHIRGRQGQRKERSMPPAQSHTLAAGGGLGNSDFVIPGPQPQRPSKSINRHNVQNLLHSEQKKPNPQKFFQSQYGGRFNPQNPQQQFPLPPPQSYMNRSQMQKYPLMETPEHRGYFYPTSEQQVGSLHSIQPDAGPPGFPEIGPGAARRNAPGKHDTPVIHANVKRNYPATLTNPKRVTPNYAVQQYVHGFHHAPPGEVPISERREEILTPSPKLQNYSQASEYENPHFNQSVGQMAFQPRNGPPNKTEPRRAGEARVSDVGSHQIAVEPMFGNEYVEEPRNMPPLIVPRQQYQQIPQKGHDYRDKAHTLADETNPFAENYRGKTSTSSQRTLRYNDFELVQKQAENDPKYEVHLDEADEKESRANTAPKNEDLQYPDIKMQKLYESNDAKKYLSGSKQQPPFGQSRHSLPKMVHPQSLARQQRGEKQRRHLNSNDTQLASHTINLNASVSQQSSPHNLSQPQHADHDRTALPNTRIVHRSLPPAQQQASKISVKKGISIMNPSDIRVGRFQTSNEPTKKMTSSPPISMAQYKFVNAKSNKRSNGHSNSNSRSRFDFQGPYAQNLKRPKLYEARGTQKIALKNHLASLQQQRVNQKNPVSGAGPFNSEVFAPKRNSYLADGRNQFGSFDGVEDRGEKHSYRFQQNQNEAPPFHQSEEYHGGNYVIQHQMLPQASKQDSVSMPPLSGLPAMNNNGSKGKRVWVPYNKKMKLRGMQQNMQSQQTGAPQFSKQTRSVGSGNNPLLNSY